MTPQSIAQRILIALIGTTVLCLTPFFLQNYFSLKQYHQETLDQDRQMLGEQAQSSLALPMYNLDSPQLNQVLFSLMKNRSMAGGVIRDIYPPHTIMAAVGRDENWQAIVLNGPPTYPAEYRDQYTLRFQGREIGTLQLYFTDRFFQKVLRESLVNQSLSLLALTFLLCVAMYFVLKKTVIQPLRSVASFALAIGEDEETAQPIRNRNFALEILHVKEALEQMMLQLRSRFHALTQSEEALRESEKRLHHMAHHDTLTDMPNRLLFYDRLEHAIARAARIQGRVAVLFLDVDRFKNVNDTLGHDIGDQLLIRVAQRLKACVRNSDTVARLGGDEFVVILEDLKDQEQAAVVAQKVLTELPRPICIENLELRVTISIGISLFPEDGTHTEELMKNADVAMYQAKEQGRDTYRFFRQDMGTSARKRLSMEHALRVALEQEQFLLHYQPQFNLDTDRISSLEALVRWNHPERGMVSPGEFIPVAEETGLIEPIGAWVLREACRQNRVWMDRGLPVVPVAVNLSARQLRHGVWEPLLMQVLKDTGLPSHLLELEITESLIMENIHTAEDTLRRMMDLGVKLALDDFGSGYSSLAYLRHFPLNKLKIDQAFVRDLMEDSGDAGIIRTIISLGQGLALEVVAEGIEEEAQKLVLKEFGCTSGQGFLLGRPMPAIEIPDWLRKYANE